MANISITQLPAAQPLDGTELVPIVQQGVTVRTTTAAVAGSPSLQQTFLTKVQEPTLPDSRYLSTSTGIGLTDGGAQSYLRITLNGASGSLEAASTGLIAKDSASTVINRSIQVNTAGIAVTNGSGVAGDPTLGLDGLPLALAGLGGTGLIAVVNGTTLAGRQVQGTTNQIDVTNGNGASNIGLSFSSNAIFPGLGGVTLPNGATGDRAGNLGTIRYNTTLNQFEGYTNVGWNQFSLTGGVTSFETTLSGLTPSVTTTGAVTLAGTLGVASGGTGANTLTGYVIGNGIGAMTASATIPTTDLSGTISNAQLANSSITLGTTTIALGATSLAPVGLTSVTVTQDPVSALQLATKQYVDAIASGLGTMATQNANAVAITGGAIDGTTIGGTTPAAGTFTTVAVPTSTGSAAFTKNETISGWTYSGVNKSVSAQETAGTGLFFSSDGLKMYVVGSTADTVFQYNLSSAWDISTATFTVGDSFSVAGQDSATGDIYFKPDGTAFYLVGDTNNTIYQYTIATPWVINTSTYASKSFSVATQETSPSGIWFKPDGTIMYVVGSATDAVQQYALSVAWDVSTASFTQSFSISAQETASSSLQFSNDGLIMYVAGTTGDDMNQYNLGTAWNITTAVFYAKVYFSIGAGSQLATVGATYNNLTQNKVWALDSTADAVYQFNTNASALQLTTDNFYTNAYTRINNNVFVDGGITAEGYLTAAGSSTFNTATVTGTLTASSTLSLTGSTTGTASFATAVTTANTSIATAQTTGTLTLGGTTQTGAITVGQSTGAQTLNLGTGATLNATTKTINIGTAGVSGSTTNINIGSAVSGATGTITFSSGGTQMAVTNTASAVNYVQVTGGATGSGVTLSAQGSDTNVALNFASKAAQNINFRTGASSLAQFVVVHNGATVVNQTTATGSATGFAPIFGVQGSDTNISQVFQSKGTGAIDLAAGSSGVNISNGGTVTALTTTNGGSGYTSVPSVTISPPTTAGGVQAVATAAVFASTVPITSGGTGYTVGNTLTAVGGTGTALTLTVATVSAGVITSVTLGNYGYYTATPANPVSFSGGSGSGFTSNCTWQVHPTWPALTNAGSGYVEQPTVSFSGGGGGSGAAAYATVGSGTIVRSLGSTMSFVTPNQQTAFQVVDYGGSATSGYWASVGGNAQPQLWATGTNSAIIATTSAVPLIFGTGGGGNAQFRVSHTASAVNYVQVTGGATGSGPTISAQGSDTNAFLAITSKGTSAIRLQTGGSNQVLINNTTSAINQIALTGSTTGNATVISNQGTDTNIDLALTPKGTGKLVITNGLQGGAF